MLLCDFLLYINKNSVCIMYENEPQVMVGAFLDHYLRGEGVKLILVVIIILS